MSNVFENLSEDFVEAKLKEYQAQGMSEDDAFTELYSMECNEDDEQ